MADIEFEDPFDDSFEDILASLFEQVEILWPDPDDRPDIREGSLLYTLLSPIAFEIQRFQGDLNLALELGFIQFTFGEFLDLKGEEFGLLRKQGSQAEGIIRFLGDIGTVVPTGTTVGNVPQYDDDETFLFDTMESGTLEGIEDPNDVNEVQKVIVDGTGRFTLTFDGDTTWPLDANDTGTSIATALEAFAPTANYSTYNISGDSGIANGGGASVTFDGGDVEGTDIPLMTATPYQVNEEQRLFITGAGTFEITFDGDETAAVLTENSDGNDIVAAINSLSPTIANTYGAFSVSTTTPTTQVDAPGGVIIVFDGGGVEYKNVPTLQVTSKTGTISETVTTLVIGEDSDSVITIEEVVKGRRAKPLTQTTDQNEKQKLTYITPEVEVETIVEGAEGSANQKWQLFINGNPPAGDLVLQFNDGSTTYLSDPILFSDNATNIEARLAAADNIGSTSNVNVTSISGGPTISNGPTIFEIEFVGNLRYQNLSTLSLYSQTFAIVNPVTVTKLQNGSAGTNEKQTITFKDNIDGVTFGPIPDGGTYTLTISDEDGSGTNVVGPLDYDATAGEILDALEESVLYGRGTAGIFNLDFNDTESVIKSKIEALAGVGAGNINVDCVSPPPANNTVSPSSGNAVYDVEFVNGLANQGFPIMKVKSTSNTFSPSTSVSVTRLLAGSPSQNEKQRITFTGTPTSGSVDIQFYQPTMFPDNFSVSGNLLSSNGVEIEYKGKNRYKDFKPVVVSLSTSGVPTSGNYKLKYNSIATANIAAGASTQTVETALNALSTVSSIGGLIVRVANGFQTIEFSGGTTGGTFTLTAHDGATSQTTAAIAHNATASTVKTSLEALSIIGSGNVEVVSSGGTLSTGATYTVYFLNSNTKLYKHFVPNAALLTPATTIDVGPDLTTAGGAYDIRFNSAGTRSLMEYDKSSLTLTPEPNEPVLARIVTGDLTIKERQVLTLTHPAGLFALQWGNESVPSAGDNITALISPQLDTATSIKYKIESLPDINTGVTVTGGPLFSSPVSVEFSGLTLSGTPWPEFAVVQNTLTGGYLEPVLQTQMGFGGAGGSVNGTVQYVYTIVSELGIQDGPDDIDYEEGYGETAKSLASDPLVVANNKVLIKIAPIARGNGLIAPREIRVYRKLTTGFTSTPYRYITTINEGDINIVDVEDETPPPDMEVVDNVSLSAFNAEERIAPTANTTGVLELETQAQEIGDEQNLAARTIEILDDSIVGIERVTNPEPFGGGSDIESDDDYRARLLEYIQKDPGAGNIDDYISWAKEVEGVAGASVIPEWQEIYGPLEGPGTVKVVVAGEDSTIIPDSVIEDVRQHIAGTIAIPDPDQDREPAVLPLAGGSIEDGVYEYVYTFINVGKGETKPCAASRVILGEGNNTVELTMELGQGGIGVQNTIGRRIYRRKIDGAISGEPESEKFVLVAEVLENITTKYIDSAAFADLPKWLGYPNGPYERRKAPKVNSTSLFDGEAPIGAHVTVESISEETIWVYATIYPKTTYSIDGSGGKTNLTVQLDKAIQDFFKELDAGQDVKYVDIANVIHDHPGVHDFKDLVLYSPVYPLGTTSNIPIGPGVSPQYSSAGTFSLWTGYSFDK